MPWFENHYKCSDCGEEWQDQWSAMCDDECPSCGTDNAPEESTELPSKECNTCNGTGMLYPVKTGRKFATDCKDCDGHGSVRLCA